MSSPQEPDPEQIAQLQQQLATVAAQLRDALAPTDYGAAPPAAPDVARLADPPRPVPFTFRIAAFAWSWWEGFAIFIGVVAPIALWAFFPELIPSALISAVAVIAYVRGGKAVRRIGLVKKGVVATVTNADELSRGTYYSGTTYSNMWVTQAHGWEVTRSVYSGPASKTKVDYAVGESPGRSRCAGFRTWAASYSPVRTVRSRCASTSSCTT